MLPVPPEANTPVSEEPVLKVSEDRYMPSYPNKLDLRPGSELHRTLVQQVILRARCASSVMQNRYPSFKKIDQMCTAFIAPDAEEAAVQAKDPRRPTSIVIPLGYSVKETFQSYFNGAFLDDIVFPFEPGGPEDSVGVVLMQHIIQQQANKARYELPLNTMWSDTLKYGFGVISARWDVEIGRKTVEQEVAKYGFLGMSFGSQKIRNTLDDQIVWEGNVLENVDPYTYLPDPNVPIHEVQRGEFVGWLSVTNRMDLLTREQSGSEGLFNCSYLSSIKGRSFLKHSEDGRNDRTGIESRNIDPYTHPMDVIWMYINLIPSEWKLGPEQYPQKWVFAVANDRILIQARPLTHNHNRFPVVVAAPDTSGYDVSPISRLEMIYGMQHVGNFLFNSHIANIKKTLNDMLIVDPFRINMNDLLKPGPGKIIRLRRAGFNQGVQGAIEQLKINDVTGSNISDLLTITNLVRQTSGAVDSMQGILRSGPERLTAEEYRGTASNAVSRMAMLAKIMDAQAHRPLADILASHTIQYITQESYVKLLGDWPQRLALEYNQANRIQQGFIKVSPSELSANYDVVPRSNLNAKEFAEVWLKGLEVIRQDPMMIQELDTTKIFLHWARLVGAKNADDFRRAADAINVSAQPMPQVEQQVQAGNLVPMGAGNGRGNAGY
jgi:hypothetical protein